MSQELIDNLKDLRHLQKEMELLKEDQDRIRAEIEKLIIKENMTGKKFHLKDRYYMYKKKTISQGFTQDYIKKCLQEYHHNKPREAEAEFRFILDNREKKSVYGLETIKRKNNVKNSDEYDKDN